jgi:hypothetical protein
MANKNKRTATDNLNTLQGAATCALDVLLNTLSNAKLAESAAHNIAMEAERAHHRATLARKDIERAIDMLQKGKEAASEPTFFEGAILGEGTAQS